MEVEQPVAQTRVCFLVADDSPTVRRQVREMLERRANSKVLTVTDGEHALDLLRETPEVGCVIMGTKMPNLGGLGLLEAIRKSEQWRRLPTLVMIETGDEATITLAATLGTSGYIMKPLLERVLGEKLAFILAPRPTEAAD